MIQLYFFDLLGEKLTPEPIERALIHSFESIDKDQHYIGAPYLHIVYNLSLLEIFQNICDPDFIG
jgi:hypothetical protein